MATRTAIFHDGNARQFDHPWLEAMVAALDERLRQRQGVFEFSRNPDCLFRIQVVPAVADLILSDGVRIRAGDRLIGLHLWNEQIPAFPANGPTLAWAHRIQHAFDVSLLELARFLAGRSDLDDVAALCGNMGLGTTERSGQARRLVERFGFEQIAVQQVPSLATQLHWFGENILIAMMILARNAAALRADALWRDRTLVFLSRRKLQDRYVLRMRALE